MELSYPDSLQVEEAEGFRPFSAAEGNPDICIRFTPVSELPPAGENELSCQREYSVFLGERGETKLFRDSAKGSRPYAAVCPDWDNGRCSVFYLPGAEANFTTVTSCFRHIGFEALMMSRGRLLLHSSLVETPLGGILFSGISGIGKSTQAELWHRCEGSRIINGDRPILYQGKNGWLACGSPYAGSSKYFVNQTVPIFAILLLEQGTACRLCPVTGAEAFQKLYAGTVVNTWNREYVSRTCDLLTDLVARIPVFNFCCTPDEKAVTFLKKELF